MFLVSALIYMSNGPQDKMTTPLKILPLSNDAPSGFLHVFKIQVSVFGIRVYGTAETSNEKVLHAAHVLAQYLDNDEDGVPDNPDVVAQMRRNRASIIMFATERDREETELEAYIPEHVLDAMSLQDLYGEETRPNGASEGRFDAALEEILHLITSAGYADVYPTVFGERANTAVGEAMDIARGGHFRQVPRSYPKSAWFTYYDETCDYGCQITEYIYWALTSILGGQNFPGRAGEIGDEWRLYTTELVRERDPQIYALLTNPQYNFPSRLPDGNYGEPSRLRNDH